MTNRPRAVVIGGGIQGASALFHLATAGSHDCLLLEKGELGGGCTAATSGWFQRQSGTSWGLELSLTSVAEQALWPSLLGTNAGFVRRGSLVVAPPGRQAELCARLHLLSERGVRAALVGGDDLRRLAPFLALKPGSLGVLCQEDGTIDAQSLLQGYIASARRLGATVWAGTGATGIAPVTQCWGPIMVRTSRGDVSADVVVNAAGSDAADVAAWFGIELPLTDHRVDVFTLAACECVSWTMPLITVLENEPIFFQAERDGRLAASLDAGATGVVGKTATCAQAAERLATALETCAPGLVYLGIVNYFSGIRVMTPDGMPILGPVAGYPGYINDCGWGGTGVVHAAAGGQLVACAANPGTADSSMLQSFGVNRFGGGPD